MECWIFLHFPIERWIEPWINDHPRIFDAWADGGVRGLVVGNLHFRQKDGSYLRAYAPDPRVYESLVLCQPRNDV